MKAKQAGFEAIGQKAEMESLFSSVPIEHKKVTLV